MDVNDAHRPTVDATRRFGALLAAMFAAALVICSPAAASPPNDDFVNSEVVSGTLVDQSGTTAEATLEAGEPRHHTTNYDGSVWYAWAAPGTGNVVIDTCNAPSGGSSGVLAVAVYSGTALDSLISIGSSQCRVTVPVSKDVTYRIAIGGRTGSVGAFTLTLDLRVTPLNDDFVDAEPIVGESFTGLGTTLWATKETGEPSHSTSNPYATKSVWYSWTAPKSGAVNINAADGKFNVAAVAAYTGNAVNSLTLVNRGYNTLTFTAAKNTTYRIALAGDIAFSGPFTYQFDFTPLPSRYRLTVDKAGNGTGTVSAIPEQPADGYPDGAEVTLTADPGDHSILEGWSGCDEVTEGGACLVTMDGDRTVAATFDFTIPPLSDSPPALSGTGFTGQRLDCRSGNWRGATRTGTVWMRNGEPIEGNTGPQGSTFRYYVPTAADTGAEIACLELGVNGHGRTYSSPSAAVTVRTSVPQVAQTPVLTTSIATGEQVVPRWLAGNQLRCQPGEYSNPSGDAWIGRITEWTRNGVEFDNVGPSGSTRMLYNSTAADSGSVIVCRQTARNIFGDTIAESNAVHLVDDLD